MQTVILAGGRGTRLLPITDNIPKPMVLVNGKPFLEHMLLMLKRNSLRNILLCIGYLGDKIESYFGDGDRHGIEIKYSHEKEPIGTAGALKLAEGLLEEEFLVLYGDSYLDIDYGAFIDFFKNHKAVGAVAIYNNASGDTGVKNNIALEGDIVTGYYKDKDEPSLKYVEAGASIFRKDVLRLMRKNSFMSLENEIFPLLIKDKELRGYKSERRFYDIGTLQRLEYFKGLRI